MSKLGSLQQGYTFDDVVLVPQSSSVKSREDPSLETTVASLKYTTPIISSPMNTVTEDKMLVTMGRLGGIGVLHRYMSVDSQLEIATEAYGELLNYVSDPMVHIYVAIGVNDLGRVKVLGQHGFNNYCVDVANGHNDNCAMAVKEIKSLNPDARVMAGNVCTYKGALELAKAGASSIRVGIGSGSVCVTRQITGHGMPQLTAIDECVKIKHSGEWKGSTRVNIGKFSHVSIIADGGIRHAGDIVKSLAMGADAVMIGGLLAASSETPGEIIEESGQLYKYYNGMASDAGRAGWFDRSKTGPAEGVSIKTPYAGKSAHKIIQNLAASVKVGLSYSGASNLVELRNKAELIGVTSAGWIEGTPHGKK